MSPLVCSCAVQLLKKSCRTSQRNYKFGYSILRSIMMLSNHHLFFGPIQNTGSTGALDLEHHKDTIRKNLKGAVYDYNLFS